MARPSLAQQERQALCDLFDELGPDAPTLCEGWTTHDLAVHLVVRERRPDAAPGILVPPLAGLTDRAMAGEKRRHTYAQTVQRVRSGPPIGPWRLLDAALNLQEYVVHHEDVRRPNGQGPRPEAEDVQGAVAGALRRQSRIIAFRLKGLGLEIDLGRHGTIPVKQAEPRARLVGDPIEAALYVTGRKGAAQVELGGPPEAVERLGRAELGL
jgi:uncharacterized protein (TIGR03085 family)